MKKRTLKKLNIKDINHLSSLIGIPQSRLEYICKNAPKYYRPIKRMKERDVNEPVSHLRFALDRLQGILSRIELPDYLHGGRKGCSIITNALVHTNQPVVINFDLQKFFPSIRHRRVYNRFIELGCSPNVARIITRLTTYKGCVPQGSPTSTTVANICIVPLAKRIKTLAASHGSMYTQFVDDGVISGPVYTGKLRNLIDKIIKQEGFTASPKPHKRLTQYRSQEQVVTGVKVNRRISVPAEKYNSVKNDLKDIRATVSNGTVLDTKKLNSMQGRIAHVKMLDYSKGLELQRYFENQILNSCE